jgi:hypothetical protein
MHHRNPNIDFATSVVRRLRFCISRLALTRAGPGSGALRAPRERFRPARPRVVCNERAYAHHLQALQLFNGIVFTGPICGVPARAGSLTQFGWSRRPCTWVLPHGADRRVADARQPPQAAGGGGFFTAAAELGYVYAPSFGLICLAGAIWRAFALRTGADEAYLFDACARRRARPVPAYWAACGRCSSSRGDLIPGRAPGCDPGRDRLRSG